MTKIIVDQRELRSPVAREMDKLNIDMQFEILPVADYVLSERCAVERKTPEDFYNSLFTDKKLFSQLYDLSHSYERPVLIIEGYETELFTCRRIDAKAVEGILNSIALMRIPVRYSVNPSGTARILAGIASKEQSETKKVFSFHGKRSHLSMPEKLVYCISSIPDVGPATAKDLLRYFGTIEAIARAGIYELMEVDGIGEKTASAIRSIITENYNQGGIK
jgi:Fanconi anemia group M protein